MPSKCPPVPMRNVCWALPGSKRSRVSSACWVYSKIGEWTYTKAALVTSPSYYARPE